MEKKENYLFSNRDLWKLLIPVMVEQLLTSLMGMVDTMMVSNVGSTAISAVSLVDSINMLVNQAFAALAAGGTILCSQYLGRQNRERAQEAAEQVVFSVTALGLLITAVCLLFRSQLLHFIFGSVEAEVMANSQINFFYTALSFPFLALFGCGSSIFRAQKNTKTPMKISVISNFLNIAGNAFLIWGLKLGVTGAAIATLSSRVFCAVTVLCMLHKETLLLSIRNYRRFRPIWSCIKKIYSIGIPSGIENSMFQFGKLAIQSTVSTLGTVAIAAQAMTGVLEGLNGVAAIGMGIGLMTIVGQTIGAGRDEEAAYYIKKISVWAEYVIIGSCLLVYALARPIVYLGGMEQESAKLCLFMIGAITIVKPLFWVISFTPAYGMRAAGDVRFSMLVTCITMWTCRVALCVFFCRYCGFGPIGVWMGMFIDWAIRGTIFLTRFKSRKWLGHKVIS